VPGAAEIGAGARLAAAAQFGERVLDLALDRKTAGRSLREDQFAVNLHVELADAAGGDFCVLAEAGLE